MAGPSSSTPLVGDLDEAESGCMAYFMAMAVAADVADRWAWILTIGIVDVAGGLLCLFCPVCASAVAEAIIAWTLTLAGVFNFSGLCMAEPGMRGYFGVLGALQIIVGAVMIKNPFETLFAVTIWIAVVVLLDGLYQLVVASSSRGMKGWGMALVSGLASTALAIIVFTGLPESSLYTIGTLIGVNLLLVGNFRIHIALEGRELANE